jgi:hypothetical protein
VGEVDGRLRSVGVEEFGHGAIGEVAAVEDLPLVVKLGQERGCEPVEGRGVGKSWTTSPRRLLSRFSRSSGLVDQIFFQRAGCPRAAA